MKLRDIKSGCNKLVADAVPEYPVYDTDTYDGYQRPAFFTELIPRQYEILSRTTVSAGYTYKITFLEETHSELLCLDIVDAIREAFALTVKCGDRRLTVESLDYDWIDTNNDVLQISIDFANITIVTKKQIKPGMSMMEIIDVDIILEPSHDIITEILSQIKEGKIRFRISAEGALIAYKLTNTDEYMRFDIVNENLQQEVLEIITQYLTFSIDSAGHVICTHQEPHGAEEKIYIHIT